MLLISKDVGIYTSILWEYTCTMYVKVVPTPLLWTSITQIKHGMQLGSNFVLYIINAY